MFKASLSGNKIIYQSASVCIRKMNLPELQVEGEPFTVSLLYSEGLEFVSTSGLTSVPKNKKYNYKIKIKMGFKNQNNMRETC